MGFLEMPRIAGAFLSSQKMVGPAVQAPPFFL